MCEHAGIGFFPHTSSVWFCLCSYSPLFLGISGPWHEPGEQSLTIASLLFTSSSSFYPSCVLFTGIGFEMQKTTYNKLWTQKTFLCLCSCVVSTCLCRTSMNHPSFFFQANSLLGLVFLRSMWGNWVTKHTKQIPWWSPVCYFGPQNPV